MCPTCGGRMMKVIYVGLPMRLCEDDSCNCLDGIFSWLAVQLPIATADGYFAFFPYEGSYFVALFEWLRGDDSEES